MKTEFKPLELEDLKLSPEDAKLIADGAAVFLPPTPDPEDEEWLHEVIDGAGD